MSEFEEVFNRMQEARQNDIVHITNWMRDVTSHYSNMLWPKAKVEDFSQEREDSLTDISDCDSEESANIVDEEAYPESRFKRLFSGIDTAKIELNKFYEILAQVAEDRKTSLEALKNKLVSGPNRYIKAMKEGYAAFAQSLKKVDESGLAAAGNVLRKSGCDIALNDDIAETLSTKTVDESGLAAVGNALSKSECYIALNDDCAETLSTKTDDAEKDYEILDLNQESVVEKKFSID